MTFSRLAQAAIDKPVDITVTTNRAEYVTIQNLKPSMFLTSTLNFFLGAAGVVSFVYLLWGGLQWITASGDKDGIDKARKKITGAIVGLIIVFSSFVILNGVRTLFNVNLIEFNFAPMSKTGGSDSGSGGGSGGGGGVIPTTVPTTTTAPTPTTIPTPTLPGGGGGGGITPTVVPTSTIVPTPSIYLSPTPKPSPTPTIIPTPSVYLSPTPKPSPTPTLSPTPKPSPTPTPPGGVGYYLCTGCISGGCGFLGEVYLGPASQNYQCIVSGWSLTFNSVTSSKCGACP